MQHQELLAEQELNQDTIEVPLNAVKNIRVMSNRAAMSLVRPRNPVLIDSIEDIRIRRMSDEIN